MPHPTPVRTSGVSLGSRFPPLHFPAHSSQVSRVHKRGLEQNAGGGVWLNAPSPLWGSPVFLQGKIRLPGAPYAPIRGRRHGSLLGTNNALQARQADITSKVCQGPLFPKGSARFR